MFICFVTSAIFTTARARELHDPRRRTPAYVANISFFYEKKHHWKKNHPHLHVQTTKLIFATNDYVRPRKHIKVTVHTWPPPEPGPPSEPKLTKMR